MLPRKILGISRSTTLFQNLLKKNIQKPSHHSYTLTKQHLSNSFTITPYTSINTLQRQRFHFSIINGSNQQLLRHFPTTKHLRPSPLSSTTTQLQYQRTLSTPQRCSTRHFSSSQQQNNPKQPPPPPEPDYDAIFTYLKILGQGFIVQTKQMWKNFNFFWSNGDGKTTYKNNLERPSWFAILTPHVDPPEMRLDKYSLHFAVAMLLSIVMWRIYWELTTDEATKKENSNYSRHQRELDLVNNDHRHVTTVSSQDYNNSYSNTKDRDLFDPNNIKNSPYSYEYQRENQRW